MTFKIQVLAQGDVWSKRLAYGLVGVSYFLWSPSGFVMPVRTVFGVLTASVLALSVMLAGCSRSSAPDVRLALINGNIVTMDELVPVAEALAVAGDTIVAVGTTDEILAMTGDDSRVIDLEGQLAIPGFIEGHGHYMGLGEAKRILDLTAVSSWEDIVAMVEEAAGTAEPGAWITGRGWHQEKWDSVPDGAVEGVPTHHDLSAASPDNPVLLGHASGHAAFANQAAMRVSGVSAETPDPSGGEIIRDARGEPTGLFRETAAGLIERALAENRSRMTDEEREAEMREQAQLAAEECLAHGITSFHDAGVGFRTAQFFRALADEGALPVRLYVMIRADSEALRENLADHHMVGYGNNFLTVRSIKRSIDGALGSHGAWLLAPYTDKPESYGLQTVESDEVIRTAEVALEYGFQLNIHAIGDAANREVLDIFADAYEAAGPGGDLRWRIEHAQHLNLADIPRFSSLGVIASMQGIHATSDAPWVYRRLGEKRAEEGAYVWQKLWQTGAIVTNGTDAPVEPVSPIASFYATVTRRLSDGSLFFEDQSLTRQQALQSYTINNAYAAFEEDIKGSITVGKLADITVLSHDILTVSEDEIPDTEVLYTIVGGDVRYEKTE